MRHAEREGPEHKQGRTEIEVDNGRFPHAFSTREGEFVVPCLFGFATFYRRGCCGWDVRLTFCV